MVIIVAAGGSIQGAIDSASAGDTILVQRGTFSENITVPAGKDRLRVIGNASSFNSSDGIHVDNANTFVVDNKTWRNSRHGIFIHDDGCWAINNRTWRNELDGIHVLSADHVFVTENMSRKNGRAGVYIDGMGHVIARNAFCDNIGAGLHLVVTFTGSIVYDNEISGNGGDGFHVETPATITTVLLLNNDVDGNEGIGIDLGAGADNRVLFNHVDGNEQFGIDVGTGAKQNVVDNNLVHYNNGAGIHVDKDALNNAARGNKLRGNRPFDITAEPPANKNNMFDANVCRRSSPPDLCR